MLVKLVIEKKPEPYIVFDCRKNTCKDRKIFLNSHRVKPADSAKDYTVDYIVRDHEYNYMGYSHVHFNRTFKVIGEEVFKS